MAKANKFKRDYPNSVKIQTLDLLRINRGNISRTAREMKLDRATVTKWKVNEAGIRKIGEYEGVNEEMARDLQEKREEYLGEVGLIRDRYLSGVKEMLEGFKEEFGASTWKERKKIMATRVERVLWDGLGAYNPNWGKELNEKDLGDAVARLFGVLSKLNDEASLVVEYRNRVMIEVAEAVKDEFGDEGLKRVLAHLDGIEDGQFEEVE